ncbi:UbiA family prenyltransferase [Nordella sp. HKS 07]|nr:UbiA family prenyltransferase [Nordella sp. HKS 07]QIG52580.1 UbiA family prenyltransferase [Nordella sp. HKS 07]
MDVDTLPLVNTPKSGRAPFGSYVALARFDHASKHVFIIPGLILAYALREPSLDNVVVSVLLGFVSAVAIASANYVLNEWLDRDFDAHHPSKQARPAVQWSLSPFIVYLEYATFAAVGLILAWQINTPFFWTSVVFLVSGLIYNVPPVRTKDLPYVDVISEAMNNPIRLTLGWTLIDPSTLPPSSIIIAYWSAGAFLMGAKRLSEYRDIIGAGGAERLHRYRRSYRYYNAESLTVSCFLYAMISAFFISAFLVKYRLEYIVAMPFIAVLFSSYLWLALRRDSIAQRPERMFHSRRLVASLGIAVIALLITSFVDMPFLYDLSKASFIPVDRLK